jgi:hypothetical protein
MTDRRRGPLGFLLIAMIVVGALLALLCGGAPAVFLPLPPALEPLRGHLTMLGIALAEAVVIVFALMPGLAMRGRDDDFYEALALPRGWTLEDDGWFGRILRGRVAGRAVDVFAQTGRHSPFANPGQLRVYVAAATGRRLHLTTRDRQQLVADVTRGLNLLRLPDHPDLVGLALDGHGARRWLGLAGVADTARRLLAWRGESTVLLRVEPDAVSLTVVGDGGHAWAPERLDAVIADLVALADALEAVGPPVVPDPLFPPEHDAHHHPERVRRKGALGLTGCLGCFGLFLVVTVVLALLGLLPD